VKKVLVVDVDKVRSKYNARATKRAAIPKTMLHKQHTKHENKCQWYNCRSSCVTWPAHSKR